jgi:serine phosphatase RsbU (regulator of sigma subunit)/anti-sigma regulatory factor (Ser/Thr protein kinase)
VTSSPASQVPSDPAVSTRLPLRAERMLAQHRLLLEQVAVDAPLSEVLHRLVQVMEDQTGGGLIASIMVADPGGQRLRHGAAPSLPDSYNAAIDGLLIGPTAGSCGTSAYRREPVIVADIEADPLWADFREEALKAGLRSCWSTPLLYGGDLLGTFAMYYKEARIPSQEDRETAMMYARTAALAIQRHRIEQARDEALATEARYARKLSRLAAVSLELASADSVDDVVRIVLQHGLDVLRADGGVIGLLDEDSSTLKVMASDSLGADYQRKYSSMTLSEQLPLPTAVRTQERVLLPDVEAGNAFSRAMQEMCDDTGLKASATVPLVSGHRALGALSVVWNTDRVFTPTQLDFIDGLAAQAAQSLQRVLERAAERRMEASARRMSEALQRSLLTRPPQVERLSVAVRYQPAMEQAQVGGDWYDVFSTADGSMMLVVGDVNGHDRDAAAAMGQLRNILRGLAYDSADGPASLLRRLDLALRGLELDSLATAVVARVPRLAHSESVRVTVSSAGHPPPLLRKADGNVSMITTEPDLLLGLAAEMPRREVEVELAEGSTLLFFTDGLIENRGEDLDDGIARLSAHLEKHGDLPLEELCDDIVRHMLPDGGEDDVALLVVRPRHETERAAWGGSIDSDTAAMPVTADPAAVQAARSFVDSTCRQAGMPGDVRDNAVLLTSELVTNSIVHANSDALLLVSADASRVRVEVRDADPALPEIADLPDDAPGGRGLVLVQLLATRWDATPYGSGKAVWFEFDS